LNFISEAEELWIKTPFLSIRKIPGLLGIL
jgi:hypothetical protein